MPERPQKITFAEIHESGVGGLLIYCADYNCGHSIAISGDCGPTSCRLIELRFVRRVCLSHALTMSAFLVRQVTIY